MKRQSSKAPATTRKSTGQMSAEERQRLIAEAAYYRALRRGFQGGNPVDDWYAAEREINASLLSSPQGQKAEDRATVRGGTPVGVGRNGAHTDTSKGSSPIK